MEIRRTVIAWVILLGLSACNKYDLRSTFISYGSANERVAESLTWNETHPFREITVMDETYTLFSMGDSHVGGTENLDTFFQIAYQEADILTLVGDLTTGQSEDFETFEQHLPDSSANYFTLVGNHDLYFEGWEEYFSRFGSSTFLFTVKTPSATDLFLCLDSGSGTLGSIQLDWLKEILENERDSYRHCILLTHNNLFRFRRTMSTNPVVEELQVLLELITEHEIDMVITAHDHVQNANTFGNTTLLTMDALTDENPDAGYLRVDIAPEELAYEFVRF